MRSAHCCFFAAALCLCAAANVEPLGLVLSGGGAKGAYEVGVWQELQAAGLTSNVTVISGTSVGALNAALFATKPESAEKIWLEKMKGVFAINTNRVGQSIQKTMNDVSNAVVVAEKTGKRWKGFMSLALATGLRLADDYVREVGTGESRIGYIDSAKLATALDEVLFREWPSIPSVYVTALEKGGGMSKTWRLNAEPHERRVLMLRASSAIPVGFDTVIIDDKVYVDGGWESNGGNNVPIDPILKNHHDVKTVIVVYLENEKRLNAVRRAKNNEAASAQKIRQIEIIPSENINGMFGIGGAFDTRPETARRLIELGRKDAREALTKSGMIKVGK